MNLILCGLQACGKTTYGKHLSTQLNLSFVDTDRLIESAYATQTGKQLCCREIYNQEGVNYFRALEQQEVTRLQPLSQTVIATGGGTLQTDANVQHLKRLGKLLYLKVPLDVLWKRMVINGLPAYLDPQDPQRSFYKIAKQRISFYEQIADLIIESV